VSLGDVVLETAALEEGLQLVLVLGGWAGEEDVLREHFVISCLG